MGLRAFHLYFAFKTQKYLERHSAATSEAISTQQVNCLVGSVVKKLFSDHYSDKDVYSVRGRGRVVIGKKLFDYGRMANYASWQFASRRGARRRKGLLLGGVRGVKNPTYNYESVWYVFSFLRSGRGVGDRRV